MTLLLFVGRRLLWTLPTFLGAMIVIFLLTQAVPGDAAMARVGQYATPDTIAAVTREMGLDKPKIVRLVIGNPLVMKEMAKHIPDAGSYARVTVLVNDLVGQQIPSDTPSRSRREPATL